MLNDYLLHGNEALNLYKNFGDLPIYDYHCHLSPKEIYEDKPFEDIGEMFLAADHYKWRLMRRYGIDEKYITGNATYKEKFIKFASALETAAMSPLYYWTHMELSIYFDIDDYLNTSNAEEIYYRANEIIKKRGYSPKTLINNSNVKYIATTDNVFDSLEYHKLLSQQDNNFKVAPSFRTDAILNMPAVDFSNNVKKLEKASDTKIISLADYKAALLNRMDFFVQNGCRFSDVGLPYFPNRFYDDSRADAVFVSALNGAKPELDDFLGFLGNMYLFLAQSYKQKGLVMQMHLGVLRNANTELFNLAGPDCGVDCMGDDISPTVLVEFFDKINSNGGLPFTILYSLIPGMYPLLSNISASFNKCITGAAWWFCDNKRGIENQIKELCEQGHIGKFLGMLTDSRSFLSYARHDFFRRIFCNEIGYLVDHGEFDKAMAQKLVADVFITNIKQLVEE